MTNCIFCKIANKEMGTLIYEDEFVVAFDDINLIADSHILIIPKKHIATINDISSDEDVIYAGKALAAAAKLAKERGLNERGYRLVANCNDNGGQTVFHLHFHLIGGMAMGWPPFPHKK